MLKQLMQIVDLYRDRIEAKVVERTGGCFDISLEVDDLSVGCIRLESEQPFMVYRLGVDREPMAMNKSGRYVDLP